MQYITLIEKISLGNNDLLNRKLKLRMSFINEVIEILDRNGVKAEIVLIAQTTDPKGMISFQFNCEDEAFKETLIDSLSHLNGAC